VKSIAVVDKKQIGVIPLRSQVQTFLRGSWGLLGIGVLIAAVLLAFVVRAWAALRGGQA
jgi:DMSO reductase anchor subunit